MLMKAFTLGILALGMTTLTAHAAIHGAATIDIPYRVQVGGAMLAPGQYMVREVTMMGYEPRGLDIYSADGQKFLTSTLAAPAYRLAPTDQNEVEVSESARGSQYHLDKIWIAYDNWGFDLTQPGS